MRRARFMVMANERVDKKRSGSGRWTWRIVRNRVGGKGGGDGGRGRLGRFLMSWDMVDWHACCGQARPAVTRRGQ